MIRTALVLRRLLNTRSCLSILDVFRVQASRKSFISYQSCLVGLESAIYLHSYFCVRFLFIIQNMLACLQWSPGQEVHSYLDGEIYTRISGIIRPSYLQLTPESFLFPKTVSDSLSSPTNKRIVHQFSDQWHLDCLLLKVQILTCGF